MARAWTPLGGQEVTPHRQIAGRDRMRREAEYATKAGVHLWTAVVVHIASGQMLDAMASDDPTALPILDADTMAGPPALVCFVCEQPYSARLRRRRCPGEPS